MRSAAVLCVAPAGGAAVLPLLRPVARYCPGRGGSGTPLCPLVASWPEVPPPHDVGGSLEALPLNRGTRCMAVRREFRERLLLV